MKFIVFYITIALFSCLSASTVIGKVELFQGNVKIKRGDSIKKERVSLGLEIKSGDLVVTSKKSSVKITLTDNSVLVLAQKSSIYFNALTDIEQKNGKILYKIASRNAKNALKVKTPFAIIGIKGTTFIVNSTDKSSYISLKEGLIGVESLKEEFELYRQKVHKEFDDYRSKELKEFEKFKNVQQGYAEVEYTKEFDVTEGHRISFDKQTVKEESIVDEFKTEFEAFDKILSELE